MLMHLRNGKESMKLLESVTSILLGVHLAWKLKELLFFGIGPLISIT
jgi:hypothetical protein